MMFWRVLVFNLILFCTRRSGVLANGQGNKAPIPELLRPFFEDNQVPSDGLFPGLNEDLLEATTIGRKDQHETRGGYDFIIVGGGTTGSVLASRLTENPRFRVLLLEAGQSGDITTEIPAASFYLQGSNYTQTFQAERTEGACLGSIEGRCGLTTGVGLGGSSLTNNMLVIRGSPDDFDQWEAAGNDDWSFEDLLPFFKKSERVNLNFPADRDYRSEDGMWSVETPQYVSKLATQYLTATRELDHEEIDFNGEYQIGSGIVQGSTLNGRRHSVASAYLHRVHRKRTNLVILTGALVKRVLIDDFTKTAFGVEYFYNNRMRRAVAVREVILSAGTFRSPQLLMLSGVGPQEHLKSHGIHCKMNLPVGENLHDHLAFPGVTFLLSPSGDGGKQSSFYKKRSTSDQLGVLTSLGFEAVSFLKLPNSTRSSFAPDAEVLMFNRNLRGLNLGEGLWNSLNLQPDIYRRYLKPTDRANINSMTLVIIPLQPKVRGSVTLRSKKVESAPVVTLPFLNNEEDMQEMLGAIQQSLMLLETDAMKQMGARLHNVPVPGCELFTFASEDYWRCAVRVLSVSFGDHGGTVKMGPFTDDPMAVVDDKLRVHGIRKLRVADRSIFPTPVSGQSQAIAIVVGEKLADIILDEYDDEVEVVRFKDIDVIPNIPMTPELDNTLARIILPKSLAKPKEKFLEVFDPKKIIERHKEKKEKKKGKHHPHDHHHHEHPSPMHPFFKQDELPEDKEEKSFDDPPVRKEEKEINKIYPPIIEKEIEPKKEEKEPEMKDPPKDKDPEIIIKKEEKDNLPPVIIQDKETPPSRPRPPVVIEKGPPSVIIIEKESPPSPPPPPPAPPKDVTNDGEIIITEAERPSDEKVDQEVVIPEEDVFIPQKDVILPEFDDKPIYREIPIYENEGRTYFNPQDEANGVQPSFFGSSSSSSSEEGQSDGRAFFIPDHPTWKVPSMPRSHHHHHHHHHHHRKTPAYHYPPNRHHINYKLGPESLPGHFPRHQSHESVYVSSLPYQRKVQIRYETNPIYRFKRNVPAPETHDNQYEVIEPKALLEDTPKSENLVHITPQSSPRMSNYSPAQSLIVELSIRPQATAYRTGQLQLFRGILRPVTTSVSRTYVNQQIVTPSDLPLDDPSLKYDFTIPIQSEDPSMNATDAEVFRESSEESDEDSEESEENYHGRPPIYFNERRKTKQSDGYVRIMSLDEFYNEVNQIEPQSQAQVAAAQEKPQEAAAEEEEVKIVKRQGEEEAMVTPEEEKEAEEPTGPEEEEGQQPKEEEETGNKEPTTSTTVRPTINRSRTTASSSSTSSRPTRVRTTTEPEKASTTTRRPTRGRTTTPSRPIYTRPSTTRRPLITRPSRERRPETTAIPRTLQTTTHFTQRFTDPPPTKPSQTTRSRTTERPSVKDREGEKRPEEEQTAERATTKPTRGTPPTRTRSTIFPTNWPRGREFTTGLNDLDVFWAMGRRDFQDRFPEFKVSSAITIDQDKEPRLPPTTERVPAVHEKVDERFPNSRAFARMFPEFRNGFSNMNSGEERRRNFNPPPPLRKKPQSYSNVQKNGQNFSWNNITLSF